MPASRRLPVSASKYDESMAYCDRQITARACALGTAPASPRRPVPGASLFSTSSR